MDTNTYKIRKMYKIAEWAIVIQLTKMIQDKDSILIYYNLC